MAVNPSRKRIILTFLALELSDSLKNTRKHLTKTNDLFQQGTSDSYLKTEVFKYLKTRKRPRIDNFVEVTVPMYTIEEFRARFRLERSTFQKLHDVLTPLMEVQYTRQTYIPFDKQILTFIFYAATQCPLIRVADVFGMSEASVFNIVLSLSDLIVQHLLREFIRWPEGNRINDIIQGFKEAQGFPGVIGAIDGTHVPIRAPSKFPENYINRKGVYSINCMAVCDHEHYFTDIYIGWTGSTHDARVFNNSPLHAAAVEKLENTFPQNCHLIGDSAYTLDNYIMVPFKDFGNLTRDQKLYNFRLSSTRMKIEHSYGILKGRFRRLKFIDMGDMDKLNNFISSCFVLHNMALTTEEAFDDFLADGLEGSIPIELEADVMDISRRINSGVQKRKNIVKLINE